MKPIRLEFQAFGSYPGREVIDFAALARRGLFVVTGPTGSGKSTIFDAMVFALYGSLPGARAGSDVECRSQHAGLDTETYVTLEFEVDDTRYRVERRPTQERRAKRGGGTTTQAGDAALVRIVGGGQERIASRLTNVTVACQEIIGLDAAQFQRVVLLPQGAFNAFLFAKEDEREKLLRPLFGGQVYGRVTDWLRDEAERLAARVKAIDTQIEHHLRNAAASVALSMSLWSDDARSDNRDPAEHPAPSESGADGLFEGGEDAIQRAIDSLLPEREARYAQVSTAQERARVAGDAAATAGTAAAIFDNAAQARQQLTDRAAERDSVAADEARVEASRRARPVRDAVEQFTSAQGVLARAQGRLDAVVQQVSQCFEALRRPRPELSAPAVSAAIQAASGELQADEVLVAERDRAQQAFSAAQASVERARAALVAADAAEASHRVLVTGTEAEVNQLIPLASGVDARRLEMQRADRVLAERTTLDDAHRRLGHARTASDAARVEYETVMGRFVATQAPRLAAGLSHGSPCPVCGSVEHPAPAQISADEAVGHEEVDAARERWAEAQNRASATQTEIETLASSLGPDALLDVTVVEEAAAAARSALGDAEGAALRLVERQTALRLLTDDLDALVSRAGEQREAVAAASGELGAADAALSAANGKCAHIDVTELATRSSTVKVLRGVEPSLDTVFGDVIAARSVLEQCETNRRDALASSGYATTDEALALYLQTDEEHRLGTRVSSWKEEVTRLEAELQAYERQGIPADRPAAEQLRVEADQLHATAKDLAAEHTTASNALASAQASLDEARRVGADSAPEREERDVARRVWRTCNGDAGLRVKLERWVLSRELERVTAAGNVHLGRMSSGRYRLQRDTSQNGLRLEVHDVHTGKSRATNSLSGGEQFLASLSLALGLADVVSHGGSAAGKQFEALFVDEGFGTLDHEVLAVAVDALEQIQASGRTVGVITHVEEMKHRLHRGIEVSRLADDAGSTLRVNP